METREYTALPPEFSQPAPEFTPLPDEFSQGSGPQPPKKIKRKIKWLYSIAVLVVFGLGVGLWGGSASASQDSFPVSPRKDGDPLVTIEKAVIMRAASSNFSVVGYKYSLDNQETEFPIYLFFQVTDSHGTKTELSSSPAHVRSDIEGETGSVETTELDSKGPMVLTIYAGWDTENGIKWTATSKDVEEEHFPDCEFVIDKAVYVPAGNGLGARVEYSYRLEADPECYPFTVYAFLEDETNYNVSDPNCPVTIDQSQPFGDGTFFVSGLQGDLELHMNATFTYEDGEITIFAEKEVDMSAKKDEPEVPVYPLGDGNIVLTVYNNSFDIESADDPVFPYLKILAHETIPESEFSEFTLPEPFDPDSDDFDAVGFVLHYNSEFDIGYEPDMAGMEFVRKLGPVLTREDVEAVPPAADGNRYVNIHVLWLCNLDERPKLEVILNLGNGEDMLFEGDQPFASEGYFYLAAVPDPEREGYTFTGWYNKEGRKVDFISYYDFFPLLPGAQSREDRDWEHPQPVELDAGWKKN